MLSVMSLDVQKCNENPVNVLKHGNKEKLCSNIACDVHTPLDTVAPGGWPSWDKQIAMDHQAHADGLMTNHQTD